MRPKDGQPIRRSLRDTLDDRELARLVKEREHEPTREVVFDARGRIVPARRITRSRTRQQAR